MGFAPRLVTLQHPGQFGFKKLKTSAYKRFIKGLWSDRQDLGNAKRAFGDFRGCDAVLFCLDLYRYRFKYRAGI